MDMDAVQARREYHRQWARNNRDKVRAAQERYWTKRAGSIAVKDSLDNEKNEKEK